jgi:hypothetical protein
MRRWLPDEASTKRKESTYFANPDPGLDLIVRL